MANDTLSNQVYISRDQIRNQIISSLSDYLDLGNVDLTKQSFLSFIINTISTLTSNLFFYNVSTYKEFFLTTAQLPDSIYNLSSFLGYTPAKASYSTAYVTMVFPMGFNDPGSNVATFTMPEDFQFNAVTTRFKTFYKTNFTVTNNSAVSVKMIMEDNREVDVPVYIDSTSIPAKFRVTLPARQIITDTQQLQIQPDLQPYVFTSIDVTFADQLNNIVVAIGDPTNIYTEYSSIFLIPTGERGFVFEKKSFGGRIYFGNGFIGVQPPAGATAYVTLTTTSGEDGNVISGSIATADRIYTQLTTGEIRNVDFTNTNLIPASGGVDEESTESIRTNAIKNISTLSRLVSERDFRNLNIVIPNSPFGSNSYPVLKRSDVRCNEIQLYTSLNYDNVTIPTKNIWYEINTIITRIPKYTALSFGDELYYNVFDIVIDYINSYAYYEYIIHDIIIEPTVVVVQDPYYNAITLQSLEVSNTNSSEVEFKYNYTGTDETASCYFIIEETGQYITMTNDSTNQCFVYTFSSYADYPSGTTTVSFTLNKNLGGIPVPVSTYRCNILVSKNLSTTMISNMVQDSTNPNEYIIYDIPTVSKPYYDNLPVISDFELGCIQPLVQAQSFDNYRMLTDFINIKFADTIGVLTGMQFNTTNKRPVIDIILNAPTNPTIGDRYIIDPESTYNNDMISHRNCYMQCSAILFPSVALWEYIEPITNDIVMITNKNQQYIYSGSAWVTPNYTIPLTVSIEIYKSPSYYGSDRDLIQLVKKTLMNTFTSNFGINAELRKSAIISCVQNITGVVYCHLIEPKTDIFFNFDVNTFSKINLLQYSPEYVFFTEDSLTVKIISSY